MKIKLFLFLALMIPLLVFALDPSMVTVTNIRGESVSVASSEVFYRGETVHFTNCVMFSGYTNTSSRQDLTGLTVILTVGDLSLGDEALISQVFTGGVTTATSGIWNASITLRTNEAAKAYCETKITDSTNTFVYPFKYLSTKQKL